MACELGEPRFRLLDTTRAYAVERLGESGDDKQLARRHAEHYRNIFERAEGKAATRPATRPECPEPFEPAR